MTYKFQPIYRSVRLVSVQTVRCVACSRESETDALDPSCDKCGSAVMLAGVPAPSISRSQLDALPAGLWRYRQLLPTVEAGNIISLGEGGTPLLRAERLGEVLGLRNLRIKDESRNPTGSFLDRGATVLLSLAKQHKVKECACLTTGNLGASLAAYCAKAGVAARIRIHPTTDRGKLYQMLAYGAEVESSAAPRRERPGVLRVTAGNPYLVEGEKTTGFEVVQDLDWNPPDVIAVPVGTGGHLSTIWRSLCLMREIGLVREGECRLIGVQVKEHLPRVSTRGAGHAFAETGEILLTELEESVPYFMVEASRAVDASGGTTVATTTAQTIDSTRLLATTEGIFAEPSSASVVAAVREAVERGLIGASENVVCVITGAGLKDTKAVSRLARETRRVPADDAFVLPTPKVGGTKLALLRLLRRKPGYGYELWLELGKGRKISTASIYQHLYELESLSLVRKRGSALAKGRERILYELTRRGSDLLKFSNRLGDANDRYQSRPGSVEGPRKR